MQPWAKKKAETERDEIQAGRRKYEERIPVAALLEKVPREEAAADGREGLTVEVRDQRVVHRGAALAAPRVEDAEHGPVGLLAVLLHLCVHARRQARAAGAHTVRQTAAAQRDVVNGSQGAANLGVQAHVGAIGHVTARHDDLVRRGRYGVLLTVGKREGSHDVSRGCSLQRAAVQASARAITRHAQA